MGCGSGCLGEIAEGHAASCARLSLSRPSAGFRSHDRVCINQGRSHVMKTGLTIPRQSYRLDSVAVVVSRISGWREDTVAHNFVAMIVKTHNLGKSGEPRCHRLGCPRSGPHLRARGSSWLLNACCCGPYSLVSGYQHSPIETDDLRKPTKQTPPRWSFEQV